MGFSLCKTSYVLSIALSISLMGCGAKFTEQDTSAQGPLFGAIGSESSYCSSISTPSPATTLTATAQFYARQVSNISGLINPGAAKPIRYAEVRVLDGSGNLVQCGQTDASGGISVAIPRTTTSYTLQVLSRADNTYYKASILNNPTDMTPYKTSVSFTGNGTASQSVTLPAASYTGTLEGGAFNILDQIYIANEYLRNNTGCGNVGALPCTTFTVAPKVQIFWKPGLSPGAYYNQPTASISFFLPEASSSYGMASGIYIMGGKEGSICVDTDHFDNSVLIHEYGHFLEKSYAKSDSPGGSHNGNAIIDPRLAWSEGWANFLQGAVRAESRYVDTHGNSDCSSGTGISINLNLETITSGQDAVNGSTYLGEGIFREVSVSRALWDLAESTALCAVSAGDTYCAGLGFGPLWKTFSDASSGFASSNVRFRNIGHFNEVLRGFINTYDSGLLTNFDAVISNERQRSDRVEYARVVTPDTPGNCSNLSLQGVLGVTNYARTQDFLSYYYDGTAAHASIKLKYSGAGTPSDLDLYIWKDGYSFSTASSLVTSSAYYYPEISGTGEESISLSGQAAGYYLIQVSADPDNVGNSAASYYLETNSGSERICP